MWPTTSRTRQPVHNVGRSQSSTSNVCKNAEKSEFSASWSARKSVIPDRLGVVRSGTVRRSLQLRAVELPHREHRLHHALHLRRVGVGHELVEQRGDDLPREAEAILQPPALALLTPALDEAVPEVIDLGLVLAEDLERDGLAQRELRTTVEGSERPAFELELDRHDTAFRSRPG